MMNDATLASHVSNLVDGARQGMRTACVMTERRVAEIGVLPERTSPGRYLVDARGELYLTVVLHWDAGVKVEVFFRLAVNDRGVAVLELDYEPLQAIKARLYDLDIEDVSKLSDPAGCMM